MNLLASRQGTVAIPICADECAAVLQQLREGRIVDLAAGHHDTHPIPELGVRFTALDLLEGLLQIGQDQRMGAHFAHQHDHMELVAGDGRIVQLAQLADLGQDPANPVVLLDGLEQCTVRGVDAVNFAERTEDPLFQLRDIVFYGGITVRERHVHHAHEKLRVLLLHELQYFKVLMPSVHHLAGLAGEQGVQIVISALDPALQDAAGIGADLAGHVVGSHIHGSGLRRAQAAGKAPRKIEQHLRNEVAGVSQRQLTFFLCFADKLVVCLLQQIFKIDQMLQVFQNNPFFLV